VTISATGPAGRARAAMLGRCGVGNTITQECTRLMYWRRWAQAAERLIYQMLTAMFGGVSQLETRPQLARHLPPRRTAVMAHAPGKSLKWLFFPIFGALVLAIGLVFSAAAEAKGTGYVFVSHEKTNNIAVIDPKQDYKIIKWIQTSRRPRDMKFRDSRRLLYVACGDDDVIDVIDVATLSVVDHIPTGPSPEMFALSRDERTLYVSNEEGSSVQEISIADKTIVREIPTGAEPEGIAVSADGKTIYVTSEVTDMVHVIDAVAGVVTDNIVVGTRPRRFILLPNGKELWVSNELSGQVSVIDRATNRVSANLDFVPPGFRQVDVTPVGMTVTRDGSSAIVALGRANHVAFVDPISKKVKSYVLVGSRAWGVALSPDESTLYVANGLSDDLSIVDTTTRKAFRTVSVGRVPHSVLVDD
jgi:PQQ-dependent catabolism-associated beta-propeller protein